MGADHEIILSYFLSKTDGGNENDSNPYSSKKYLSNWKQNLKGSTKTLKKYGVAFKLISIHFIVFDNDSLYISKEQYVNEDRPSSETKMKAHIPNKSVFD